MESGSFGWNRLQVGNDLLSSLHLAVGNVCSEIDVLMRGILKCTFLDNLHKPMAVLFVFFAEMPIRIGQHQRPPRVLDLRFTLVVKTGIELNRWLD